jgi:hypothetical protein
MKKKILSGVVLLVLTATLSFLPSQNARGKMQETTLLCQYWCTFTFNICSLHCGNSLGEYYVNCPLMTWP